MPMTPTLDIRLLGGFNLTYAGEHVTGISSPRPQSLLAYLLLHRDTPQSRQHVAFLFWPDIGESQARNNLRQTLHALRQALPHPDLFLCADTNTLQWNPDAPFRLDVAEFEHTLGLVASAATLGDGETEHTALRNALDLYQDDLLPGCYDEWIVPEREALRQGYTRALDRLVALLEAHGEYALATTYARRRLASDPLSEEACRALMRLLTAVGDRAGALQVYHACAGALERELGIAPGAETTELYEHARRMERPKGHVAVAVEEDQAASKAGAPHAAPALIGRQHAFDQVRGAWARAAMGEPGLVLVTGEAGIGKSRLVEEVALAAGTRGATVAKTRCYAAEGRLSLAPVTDWLRSEGVWRSLSRLDRVWLTEVSRILPEVTRDFPDLPPYEPISEYGQRRRFFEALAQAVLAAPQPTLLVIDDLQWCDQETLEWLRYLLRFDPAARLLVLGTARTEEFSTEHPLRTLLLTLHRGASVLDVPLGPLDAAETAKLAAAITKTDLDDMSALRLYRETEGNPLFVVETVRAGLADVLARAPVGNAPLAARIEDDLLFPPRVRAVLSARLAQLSPEARELAALAAASGREFRLDVLTSASTATEDAIVRTLDELWQRRIVREQGTNTYDFTHDKLREVAYAETSIPQRRRLHRRVAQALETVYAADLDAVSGQIAAHYDQAGLAEPAIPYYQRAAVVAQRVYANEDAISFLVRALALLDTLPGGVARDARELRLLLALTPIYRVTRGWTAPELERAVTRQLELCGEDTDDTVRGEVLYGWQSLLVVQAKLARVLQVHEELQALHERVQSHAPSLSGMMAAGTRLHLGHFDAANALFERIVATSGPEERSDRQMALDWNHLVHSYAWHAHALWCLGYPERALARGHEAVRLARALVLPFNQALATAYLAMLHQLCADPATAQATAEEALALTGEYKAPYYRAWASILLGYAHARGEPDAARRAHLRGAIEAIVATGARLRLPYYLWLLASAHMKARDIAAGRACLEEALAIANTTSEHWWDAELYRLRALCLLRLGRGDREVEDELRRAAAIAQEQHARSLELRAETSLARWLRGRNRANEGRQRLGAICDWFTEGFDTPDLRAAKRVLDSLA